MANTPSAVSSSDASSAKLKRSKSEAVKVEMKDKYAAASSQIAAVFKKQPKTPMTASTSAAVDSSAAPVQVNQISPEMWEKYRASQAKVSLLTDTLAKSENQNKDLSAELEQLKETIEHMQKENTELKKAAKESSTLEEQIALLTKQTAADKERILSLEKKLKIQAKNLKAMEEKINQDHESLKEENDRLRAEIHVLTQSDSEAKSALEILEARLATIKKEEEVKLESIEKDHRLEMERIQSQHEGSIQAFRADIQAAESQLTTQQNVDLELAKKNEEIAQQKIADLEQNLAMLIKTLHKHNEASVDVKKEEEEEEEEVFFEVKQPEKELKEAVTSTTNLQDGPTTQSSILPQLQELHNRLLNTSIRIINRSLHAPLDISSVTQLSNEFIEAILGDLGKVSRNNEAEEMICKLLVEIADLRVIENEFTLMYYENMVEAAAYEDEAMAIDERDKDKGFTASSFLGFLRKK